MWGQKKYFSVRVVDLLQGCQECFMKKVDLQKNIKVGDYGSEINCLDMLG